MLKLLVYANALIAFALSEQIKLWERKQLLECDSCALFARRDAAHRTAARGGGGGGQSEHHPHAYAHAHPDIHQDESHMGESPDQQPGVPRAAGTDTHTHTQVLSAANIFYVAHINKDKRRHTLSPESLCNFVEKTTLFEVHTHAKTQ